MDGVEANVNLTMEKASVTYEEEKVKTEDIVGKIEKLGYGVPKERVELDIYGITVRLFQQELKKC